MEREQLSGERAWIGAFLAAVAALVLGSLAMPRRVYDEFVWQYFWGPIYADAHNVRCAVKSGEEITLHGSDQACQAADGVAAYIGYTTVSEIGYMVTLIFMVVGILYLLRRLDVAEDRGLFFALVPFMLFGGALRVVEDATDAAAQAGTEPAITYPLNALLISPIIYVTVFAITLLALLVSVWLEREGHVSAYHRPMAVIGGAVLILNVIYLFVLAATRDYVTFFPGILAVDLGLATILAVLIYFAVDRLAPWINEGTQRIGLVVLWAHAVDGVANVIAADWTHVFDHPKTYGAKHPANQFIINITDSIQPADLSAVIGTSWPFLVVKLVVALGIVWLFDAEIFEESPRYAILLLVAAVAVGLGPGTRDMLRVAFAI